MSVIMKIKQCSTKTRVFFYFSKVDNQLVPTCMCADLRNNSFDRFTCVCAAAETQLQSLPSVTTKHNER